MENTNIFELTDNQQSYKFDLSQKKVYKVSNNTFIILMISILIIILSLLSIYDYIKDIMRWISGTNNIIQGNTIKGIMKIEGYTAGNMMRNTSISINIVLIIISFLFTRSDKEIQFNELPINIQKQYFEKTSTSKW